MPLVTTSSTTINRATYSYTTKELLKCLGINMADDDSIELNLECVDFGRQIVGLKITLFSQETN